MPYYSLGGRERETGRECVRFLKQACRLFSLAFSSILDVTSSFPSPFTPFPASLQFEGFSTFYFVHCPFCVSCLLSSFLELLCPKYALTVDCSSVLASSDMSGHVLKSKDLEISTNENRWHLFFWIFVTSPVFYYQLAST